MNIAVLIAGVHDPKWPITRAGNGSALPVCDHQVMSPFDEAALEIALKVRDARPGTQLTVHVAGSVDGLQIARRIAALNIAEVSTFTLERPWDQASVARVLAPLCEGADLVLIGREFGDFDDGLVPAMLAGLLDIAYFSRTQAVEAGETIRLIRETESCIETITLGWRILASVTNDRRTRLRKPLMKNVMQARNVPIAHVAGSPHGTTGLTLDSLAACLAGRRQSAGHMIAGTPEEQARNLAARLWEARQ